jgi:branched-chain amino acid transport system ATP-binding protein
MLSVEGVQAGYGDLEVLHGLSLAVGDRETVALLGANGAGKTTLLRVISRLHPPLGGRVVWDGTDLLALPPHRLAALGIAHVPDGRGILRTLTVRENLELGGYLPQVRAHRRDRLEEMLTMFPILHERTRQQAGTLSGGEQQMLAVARALMLRPRLLILDEPSLGLAPKVAGQIFEVISRIVERGTAVLLVEQNLHQALAIADRGYVLETGRIALSGTSADLLGNAKVRSAYLGL